MFPAPAVKASILWHKITASMTVKSRKVVFEFMSIKITVGIHSGQFQVDSTGKSEIQGSWWSPFMTVVNNGSCWLWVFFQDRFFSNSALSMYLIAHTIIVMTCIRQWKDIFSASESMGRRPKQLMLLIHLALYREIDWKKHSWFTICVGIFKRCVCDPCYAITESHLNLLNWSAFVLMEFLSKDKSLSVALLAYMILLIMR